MPLYTASCSALRYERHGSAAARHPAAILSPIITDYASSSPTCSTSIAPHRDVNTSTRHLDNVVWTLAARANAAYSCAASEGGAPDATSYHACIANPDNVISRSARNLIVDIAFRHPVLRPARKEIPLLFQYEQPSCSASVRFVPYIHDQQQCHPGRYQSTRGESTFVNMFP